MPKFALYTQSLGVLDLASVDLLQIDAATPAPGAALVVGAGGADLSWEYPPGEGLYTCDASLLPGQVACVSGADAATQATASDGAHLAIGIVVAKPTATSARIRYAGEVNGFAGLVPGATYYLDTVAGGFVTPTPPAGAAVWQVVGFAKSTSVFCVQISRLLVLQ